MNYRHAYHAGNFADVVKHAVFALAIDYLKRKPAAFRIIDTHAGRGRYQLDAAEAAKTQEWRAGIGRLLGPDGKALPPPVAPLLEVYLDAVRAENAAGELARYPGSPALALRLMRAQDTLVANEMHPEEHAALQAGLGGGCRGVKLLRLDGWMALRALLPPPERRGVILIDPPFEEDGDLVRLGEALGEGLRRFGTGIFMAWYPIKDARTTARLNRAVARAAAAKLLSVELLIRQPRNRDLLNGCGLLIANPPFTFASVLERAGPGLARLLAVGPGANCSVRWLKVLRDD
ncbi:MAG: 23S rRNA (adenine(2030)-N(6))-methyltransferase RlmJ [Hyphomicrobiaceae bacterium]